MKTQMSLRYESDRNPQNLATTRSRAAYLLRAARSRKGNYGSLIAKRDKHHYEIFDGQEPRGLAVFAS